MHSEIAPVAEDDSITVLALRIIAYCTRRVFRWQRKVRLRNVLCLPGYFQQNHEEDEVKRTRSNHSFSKRSIITSNVSYDTVSTCSFFRSAFRASSHDLSEKKTLVNESKKAKPQTYLAHPYHTLLALQARSPKALNDPHFQHFHEIRLFIQPTNQYAGCNFLCD
jgi:hypothetical protein